MPKKKVPPTPSNDMPKEVAKVYESYEENDRKVLLELRDLIFQTAAADDRVGPLTETLKWGEPAYLTEETKSGSTVRLGCNKDTSPAIFVSCSTPLIQSFQEKYDVLTFVPPRAIVVPDVTDDNRQALQECIALTLTYHLNKKKKKGRKRKKPC